MIALRASASLFSLVSFLGNDRIIGELYDIETVFDLVQISKGIKEF